MPLFLCVATCSRFLTYFLQASFDLLLGLVSFCFIIIIPLHSNFCFVSGSLSSILCYPVPAASTLLLACFSLLHPSPTKADRTNQAKQTKTITTSLSTRLLVLVESLLLLLSLSLLLVTKLQHRRFECCHHLHPSYRVYNHFFHHPSIPEHCHADVPTVGPSIAWYEQYGLYVRTEFGVCVRRCREWNHHDDARASIGPRWRSGQLHLLLYLSSKYPDAPSMVCRVL